MKDNSMQAFPIPMGIGNGKYNDCFPGMTLREYACIKLKVPETGKKWLDEIINKSVRNDLAGQALNSIADGVIRQRDKAEVTAEISYRLADAMIKQRSKNE